ncbi:hypothetical protein DFH09DRAFT_1156767 [Mycena vulgaris]|nr:hypothetical protein DFH09DRAFT_1156767 [Mycena vulgaris]
MNHDVDQHILREQLMDTAKPNDDEPRPHSSTNPSTIFSQLRSFSNNISVNSLGSLFNSSASSSSSSASARKSVDFESWDMRGGLEDGLTPTPTRPSSPHRRFSGVKSIFTLNLGTRGTRHPPPVRIAVQSQSQIEEPAGGSRTPRYEQLASPLGSEFTASSDRDRQREADGEYQMVSASSSYGSELDDTPPLTPESLVADIASLSPGSENAELAYDDYGYDYGYGGGQDDGYVRMQVDDRGGDDVQFQLAQRPRSVEVKEGKKPARPIDFDVLLADISSDVVAGDAGAGAVGDAAPEDDKDEWYGLEYTLELSTRERRASETQSFSAGEHSKSRESWAAIHQGTIHPFFEDEEYYQWKNWHRYLERQDEKRKHRRGRAFKAHAKELAWVYTDEMHARDLIAWQMEVYGDVEKALLAHLGALEGHRPAS